MDDWEWVDEGSSDSSNDGGDGGDSSNDSSDGGDSGDNSKDWSNAFDDWGGDNGGDSGSNWDQGQWNVDDWSPQEDIGQWDQNNDWGNWGDVNSGNVDENGIDWSTFDPSQLGGWDESANTPSLSWDESAFANEGDQAWGESPNGQWVNSMAQSFQRDNPNLSSEDAFAEAKQAYSDILGALGQGDVNPSLASEFMPDAFSADAFGFNPGDIPVDQFTNLPEMPQFADDTTMALAVAAATEMPEFANMTVDDIAQSLSANPDLIQQILNPNAQAYDRQTGEAVTPETGSDALDKFAFGDAHEAVTGQTDDQAMQAALNGEPMSGDAFDQMYDQAVGAAPTDAGATDVGATGAGGSTLDGTLVGDASEVVPSEVVAQTNPYGGYIPVSVQTDDGPQLQITTASGDTMILRTDGTIVERTQEGDERVLEGSEDADWRKFFTGSNGDEQTVNVKGMNVPLSALMSEGLAQRTSVDENGDPIDNGDETPATPSTPEAPTTPATPGVAPMNIDGQLVHSGAEADRIVQQLTAELNAAKAATEKPGYLGEKDDLIKDLTKAVASATESSNKLHAAEAAAAGGKAAAAPLTVMTRDGEKVLIDSAGNTITRVKNIISGWVVTYKKDENGDQVLDENNRPIPNEESIPGINVDAKTGAMYTTATGADGQTQYVPVKLAVGDVMMYWDDKVGGVKAFDPFRISTDANRAPVAPRSTATAQRAPTSTAGTAPHRSGSGGGGGGGGSDDAAARLEEQAKEHADTMAFQYAKLGADDKQFSQQLDFSRQQLQEKMDEAKQGMDQRKFEFASQMESELAKIQSQSGQFLQNYQQNQQQLEEVMRSNREKEAQNQSELQLAREKFETEKARPEIVNLGGGQYLQFNPLTGQWETKASSAGFSGSRSRGGSI